MLSRSVCLLLEDILFGGGRRRECGHDLRLALNTKAPLQDLWRDFHGTSSILVPNISLSIILFLPPARMSYSSFFAISCSLCICYSLSPPPLLFLITLSGAPLRPV